MCFVSQKTVDKLFDLPEKEYLELMSFSRRVALAIKKLYRVIVLQCL